MATYRAFLNLYNENDEKNTYLPYTDMDAVYSQNGYDDLIGTSHNIVKSSSPLTLRNALKVINKAVYDLKDGAFLPKVTTTTPYPGDSAVVTPNMVYQVQQDLNTKITTLNNKIKDLSSSSSSGSNFAAISSHTAKILALTDSFSEINEDQLVTGDNSKGYLIQLANSGDWSDGKIHWNDISSNQDVQKVFCIHIINNHTSEKNIFFLDLTHPIFAEYGIMPVAYLTKSGRNFISNAWNSAVGISIDSNEDGSKTGYPLGTGVFITPSSNRSVRCYSLNLSRNITS